MVLQPFILQHELDLASATAIPVTLQHRVRRPLAPINLRVNGDGQTPTYGARAGVSVNWDRTDPRREDFRQAIMRAMPKMLGKRGQKSVEEQVLAILEGMIARTWRRDRAQAMRVLSEP